MKKTLLAAALAVAAFAASAHPLRMTHYHNGNQVVIGNQIAPKVTTTYETDRYGRRVRVTETTTCTDVRVNRRNNHLRCMEEETETTRVVDQPRRPEASIEPRVQRFVERDAQGRRVIVTITDTCTRAGYQRGEEVCYNWQRDVDRDYVRWNRDRNRLDLNGDGQADAWERLLFQGFREVLENN